MSTAVPTGAVERAAVPTGVGWEGIAVLAAAAGAALAVIDVGVLLPYFANDLHRLPLAEVASGAHDPEDLWPYGAWQVPVQLAAVVGLTLVPLVTLAAVGVGGVWLVVLWRRPVPQRVAKSLALLVVAVGCIAALLFLVSDTGAAMVAWRLD